MNEMMVHDNANRMMEDARLKMERMRSITSGQLSAEDAAAQSQQQTQQMMGQMHDSIMQAIVAVNAKFDFIASRLTEQIKAVAMAQNQCENRMMSAMNESKTVSLENVKTDSDGTITSATVKTKAK